MSRRIDEAKNIGFSLLPFLFANAIPLAHNMSNSLDTNDVKFENSTLILAVMTIESLLLQLHCVQILHVESLKDIASS
jgi:hypothetical protein